MNSTYAACPRIYAVHFLKRLAGRNRANLKPLNLRSCPVTDYKLQASSLEGRTIVMNFKARSPYREADSRSATQEIISLLWDPTVHYSVQKRPPPGHILSQMNTINTLQSYSPNIHFNTILPPTPRSCGWAVHCLQLPYTNQKLSHLKPIN